MEGERERDREKESENRCVNTNSAAQVNERERGGGERVSEGTFALADPVPLPALRRPPPRQSRVVDRTDERVGTERDVARNSKSSPQRPIQCPLTLLACGARAAIRTWTGRSRQPQELLGILDQGQGIQSSSRGAWGDQRVEVGVVDQVLAVVGS